MISFAINDIYTIFAAYLFKFEPYQLSNNIK